MREFIMSDYFLFGRQFYYNRIKHGTPISKERHDKIDHLLSERFAYYGDLSEDGKAKFINRLWYILNNKSFIPKEGMNIEIEHKILLSASIAQVTFGFKKFALEHFERFFIYPKSFYSNLIRKQVKGITTGMGNILLSWRDFEIGYKIPNDNYNLGLHELGHALKISVLKDYNFEERFERIYDRWIIRSNEEFSQVKEGVHPLFRKYGGTNRDEFFSVCLETFFESPGEFKNYSEELFAYMCWLLNQDPTNTNNDYRLVK